MDALANVPTVMHILVIAVSGSCGRSGRQGGKELEEREWELDACMEFSFNKIKPKHIVKSASILHVEEIWPCWEEICHRR